MFFPCLTRGCHVAFSTDLRFTKLLQPVTDAIARTIVPNMSSVWSRALCLLPGSPGTASGDPAVMTINQVAQAYRAALDEHKMPILEAARTYKEALGWSAVMATVRLWAIDCLFSIPYLSVARLRIVPSHLPLTRPADSRHASFRYQPAHLILRPARLPEAIWLCNYWGSRAVSAQARVAVRYL